MCELRLRRDLVLELNSMRRKWLLKQVRHVLLLLLLRRLLLQLRMHLLLVGLKSLQRTLRTLLRHLRHLLLKLRLHGHLLVRWHLLKHRSAAIRPSHRGLLAGSLHRARRTIQLSYLIALVEKDFNVLALFHGPVGVLERVGCFQLLHVHGLE